MQIFVSDNTNILFFIFKIIYKIVCVCMCAFSHVRLFMTPWTVALQAPLSMGFSRQEYWSGLPFPPGDHPDLGIKPWSPSLQVDSLLPEPPGKPKNTGEDSLSRLQGYFQTQESNCGLLHCRWILYQLSYQRSPYNSIVRPQPDFKKQGDGGGRLA